MEFNVVEQTQNCIDWIRNWFSLNGDENTKAVIGVSGGADSSVVAALCVEALGKERVIGIMIPNGEQADIGDSQKLIKHLGIKHYTINIDSAYRELLTEMRVVAENGEKFPSYQYRTNTPARLRMAVLYGIGAQIGNCRIVNTSNLSEKFVGYGTLWADTVGDISPLGLLTKDEVYKIGHFLELPDELVYKAPSDGMSGKTDEDNLGFTYTEVHELIRDNKKADNFEKICRLHRQNLFKGNVIHLPTFEPNLPNFSYQYD